MGKISKKMRRLKTTSFAFLLALGMGLLGGLLPKRSQNINAVSFNDTTSYVTVGEIYDLNNKTLVDDNFYILLKYLTGNSDPTMTHDVDPLAVWVTDSSEMRGKSLSAGIEGSTSYSAKSNTQDIIVTLGGLRWQVMYLSKDTWNNTILTLWLDNAKQDAWTGRSATEGKFYGFIDGALYSDWSYNWNSDYFTETNPSNMYGGSYINAVTLNNGGMYATSADTTAEATQSTSSVFAPFTMAEYGLTEHLVKPKNVSWQTTGQNSASVGFQDLLPNENLDDSKMGGWRVDATYGSAEEMIDHELYDSWRDCYLWLPSLSETGYRDRYTYTGLWKTSEEQRLNYDGSTTTSSGFVGSSSGAAYPCNWLRSGCNFSAASAHYLYLEGAVLNDCVSSSYAVRPALHLNLTSIESSLTTESISGGEMSVSPASGEYDGHAKMPEVSVIVNSEELQLDRDYTLTYKLNGVEVSEIKNAGEYTIVANGIGDYVGKLTTTYTVNKLNVSECVVDEISDKKYTGSDITPLPTVKYNGNVLVKDVDYTLSYTNNVVVGEASITITGIGNYEGSKTVNFDIIKEDTTATVVCGDDIAYEGEEVNLVITNSSVPGAITTTESVYVAGVHGYSWTFTPTDTDNYNGCSGTIEVNATPLAVNSLELSGEYKKTYNAYECLDTTNLVVSAIYNSGKSEVLLPSEYQLSISNGEELEVGDVVTITYLSDNTKTINLPITISPIEVEIVHNDSYIATDTRQDITITFENEVVDHAVTYIIGYFNKTNNEVSDGIVESGEYIATITLTNNNYTLVENILEFEVKSKVIESTDSKLVIESSDGFAINESVTYVVENDEDVALEKITSGEFGVEGNFVESYKVTLSSNRTIKVKFTPNISDINKLQVYVLTGGQLDDIEHTLLADNKIEVTYNSGDELYLFEKASTEDNNPSTEGDTPTTEDNNASTEGDNNDSTEDTKDNKVLIIVLSIIGGVALISCGVFATMIIIKKRKRVSGDGSNFIDTNK